MRYVLITSAAAATLLFGCAPSPCKTATSSATAPAAELAAASSFPKLAGRWTGSATIVVNWVQQKDLPIELTIASDGSASGKIGDANLVNAKVRSGRGEIERSLGWGREYRLHGQLEGDILAAEHVRRDAVDILFDQPAETALSGGLHSSGWEIGNKQTMKLSAAQMRLERQPGQ